MLWVQWEPRSSPRHPPKQRRPLSAPAPGAERGWPGLQHRSATQPPPSPGAARRQFARLVAIEGDALTAHASGS